LATGAPPFGSSDALRLTHDHLARVPVPPAELNPAAKHADATAVTVTVDADDATLRIGVSDDGHGGADLGGGSGLVGLKDRIEALGGRFSLHTVREGGTTVHAELPLTRPVPVESG
jgi:glucose-6-phosphate-specific signal transduction histidine kinase